MSVYSFSAQLATGERRALSDYQDQVILIVNTASECGFTPQYEGLESLYQRYRERGFVVLGFPCNQFGQQEPGDEAQILSFCEARFGLSFPIFAKVEVNGPESHPLFIYLKSQARGVLGSETIKWNFTKFLINREGLVVKRFASVTRPSQLANEIEALL